MYSEYIHTLPVCTHNSIHMTHTCIYTYTYIFSFHIYIYIHTYTGCFWHCTHREPCVPTARGSYLCNTWHLKSAQQWIGARGKRTCEISKQRGMNTHAHVYEHACSVLHRVSVMRHEYAQKYTHTHTYIYMYIHACSYYV
jgi:hypothetical protein